ncbi:IclR family transcriptional regulator [Collinsella tanakaei]|nr:IclR family transcriptional regulator [Collinsella tanakaei]
MGNDGQSGRHRSTMRVLAILDTLARSGEGMTMADICRELEAPKSSLFPILHTMAEEGYLACSEADGRYRIGFRTYLAGKAYNREKDALGILTEQLQRIVDDCGETSQLGILSHGSVLYIAKVDSPQPIRLVSDIGRALPAHCTAIGKVLLSDMSREQIAELIGETYEAHTPRTLTTLDDLYDELEQVRREGIAHDYGEITDAIECLAAPVRIDGKVRYGLGISVPSYRLTPEKRLELTELLRSSGDYLEVVLSQ